MEEKVLIKSNPSKKTKLFFIGVIVALLTVLFIGLLIMIPENIQSWAEGCAKRCYTSYWNHSEGNFYECNFCEEHFTFKDASHFLECHIDEMEFADYFDVNCWFLSLTSIVLAGIFGLIYFLLSRCNITVTDKNISGRTFWGKKVVLPIHMVSAYSTSKVFSVLAITTASGFIKFPCIGNREEIASVLQQLLNERQQKTETQEVLISKEDNSKNLNDLVKLKNLLDDGIITQEEFDAKKKEILGL